ncbi:MAG: hypothetical protein JXR91_02750 [Deltaproteobacteria bacterium]|nr:hypothetical protein [Deltaproteobacteria bacterium]
MNQGSHIPSYLLCERFAQNSSVAALYPPDERGAGFLQNIAKQIIIVQKQSSDHRPTAGESFLRITAAHNSIPFKPGSFDVVLTFNFDFENENFNFLTEIKNTKKLINSTGIALFFIPNKENLTVDVKLKNNIPDFLEFEQSLRRAFPHIITFAQHPLYGATLSPIGRRFKENAPLLDDRMLSADDEMPDFFVGICSDRFHKFDDTVIAQLPFKPLLDSFLQDSEKNLGVISLLQREKKLKEQRIDDLLINISKMELKLNENDTFEQEKTALENRVSYLVQQIAKREQNALNAEKHTEKQSLKIIELENSISLSKRDIVRLEQQIDMVEESKRRILLEKDDCYNEIEQARNKLRESSTELKQRLRQIDEYVEIIASKENESDLFNSEILKLRSEISRLKEENSLLSIKDSQNSQNDAVVKTLEAELERARNLTLNEKNRLEKMIEQEHERLLLVIDEKEASRQEVHRLNLEIKQLQLLIDDSNAQKDTSAENIKSFEERIASLHEINRDLNNANSDKAIKLEEISQLAENRADEIKRIEHAVTLLKSKSDEAEKRSTALQNRVLELDRALIDAETRSAHYDTLVEKLTTLEEKNQLSQNRIIELERALSSAENSVIGAQLSSDNLSQIKEHYAEAQKEIIKLQNELSDAANRNMELEVKSLRFEQLEVRYKAAFDQIDMLQREIEALRVKATEYNSLKRDLGNVQNLYKEAEADLDSNKKELERANDKIKKMEKDLESAMEALAKIEEGADSKIHSAASTIKTLQDEITALKQETETELIKVKEDLETELKISYDQLEQSKQEIWELKEEIVRLQAQTAATAAAAANEGVNEEFQSTLLEQESIILELQEDKNHLRREAEKLNKSLALRKSNMKILATLLKKEHLKNSVDDSNEKFDISQLIKNSGGNINDDDLSFLDEPSLLDENTSGDSSSSSHQDDDIVDAIMESVVLKNSADNDDTATEITELVEDED